MKFENTEVWGFEHALRGMRNPMNSWDKSDSKYCGDCDVSQVDSCPYVKPYYQCFGSKDFIVGENDMRLAQKLIRAGSEHRKFMRQIFVSVDITAPLYWIQEWDTYKIGTTRNSCSVQHKGTSKPFNIRDFSVDDKRIYDILDPISEYKEHKLVYKNCNDKDYKIYQLADRQYKIFRNGKVVSCKFSYVDTWGTGRVRHFEEYEVSPYQTSGGYWCVRIGGRKNSEHWSLHRLVASLWKPNDDINLEINHIDGNKGNNDIDNLEWVTHSENEIHKNNMGLVDNKKLSTLYKKYKSSLKCNNLIKNKIRADFTNGQKQTEIALKYGLSQSQVSAIILGNDTNENTELFENCLIWENIIDTLNDLRESYLETKDYKYFRLIRQLMPMGYNYKFTATMNYENILSMVKQRRFHKLTEWSKEFIDWAHTLPYARELLFIDKAEERVAS